MPDSEDDPRKRRRTRKKKTAESAPLPSRGEIEIPYSESLPEAPPDKTIHPRRPLPPVPPPRKKR